MRKVALAVALFLVLSLTQMILPAQAVSPAGKSCSVRGAVIVSTGKKFTCIKKGAKRVWNSGAYCQLWMPALWVSGHKFVCTYNGSHLVWTRYVKTTPTPKPSDTVTPTPTIDPDNPSDGNVVSNASIDNKTFMGYQAWFECPGKVNGINTFIHWFEPFTGSAATNLSVELWPDTSELTAAEKCPTSMTSQAGNAMVAYSGSNQTTIRRHFSWMQQYRIDGVALQLFVTNLRDREFGPRQDLVVNRVQSAAEKYGRVFYLEYDMSSNLTAPQIIDYIETDWKKRVNAGVTDSTQYQREGGLPVVEIWGAGIDGSNVMTAADIRILQDFFHNNPEPKYRAKVIGGVGSYWRTGVGDGQPGQAWADAYRNFDVINPWAVGRFGSTYTSEGQYYLQNVLIPDMAETSSRGIKYMPVLWPGFSWNNLMRQRGTVSPSNQIPRKCGAFFWQQSVNALFSGAKTMFVAMFDEVDEGTSMMKLVSRAQDLPTGSNLLALDVDGCSLDSDFYLRMTGALNNTLRTSGAITRDLPIQLRAGESLNGLDFTLGLPNPS